MRLAISHIVVLLLLTSCSSSPVLYPNAKYKAVGKEKAKGEVDKCMADADQFLESKKGKAILKSAGKGAVMGSVMGVVSGLIFGDVKRAAVSGAAIGAAGGATGEAITPDRLKQAYVNKCLNRKGYEVLGWE